MKKKSYVPTQTQKMKFPEEIRSQSGKHITGNISRSMGPKG